MDLLALTYINGRVENKPIYQVEVPIDWEPLPLEGDITDTRNPIASYKIGNIRLTFHNFPTSKIEERIPPMAQITRWQNQGFNEKVEITKTAHGGFGGYKIEGLGLLGYAMQLTSTLYPFASQDQAADYTIKAVGPPMEILEKQNQIENFALSLELIEPLPSPL